MDYPVDDDVDEEIDRGREGDGDEEGGGEDEDPRCGNNE